MHAPVAASRASRAPHAAHALAASLRVATIRMMRSRRWWSTAPPGTQARASSSSPRRSLRPDVVRVAPMSPAVVSEHLPALVRAGVIVPPGAAVGAALRGVAQCTVDGFVWV